METIADANGRPWSIHFTVRTIELMLSRGVDYRLPEKAAEEIYTSDLALVNFLWAMRPEGFEATMPRDEFVEAWYGESLDRAREAIERETVRFFSSLTCTRFKSTVEQVKRMADVRVAVISQMAEAIERAASNPESIELLANSLTEKLKGSGSASTESPVSSA